MAPPFSEEQLKLISSDYFFVQKNKIFALLHERLVHINDQLNLLKEMHAHHLPADVMHKQGKISQGENYNNRPYLVLDNPNVFSNDGIFTFRLIFLWGNYFTLNLVLTGKYFLQYQLMVPAMLKAFSNQDVYQLQQGSLWKHTVDEDYQTVTAGSIVPATQEFLKLTKIIAFDRLGELETEAMQFFELFLQNIKHQ